MNLPSLETVNNMAGVAALVNSLILVPSILALRKIAENHGSRLGRLEGKAKPRKRRRG